MKLFVVTRSTRTRIALSCAIVVGGLSTFLVTNSAGAAGTAVPLGTTAPFSVLAGSTVTNTGPSVINGDVGLSPGSSVTGFPPGVVNGTQHVTDAVAGQAEIDLTTAYNNAMGQGPTTPIVADLGGQTLSPGVYNSASSIGLTGVLTLNGGGNPNAVFIFQADTSTLTTASASQVNLINGAQACNVFWQVGSSATLGSGSQFSGTILASASITVTTDVTIQGRVLAWTGAVTLDTDTITAPVCATATTTTTAPTATSSTTTTAKQRTAAKAAAAKAKAAKARAAGAAAKARAGSSSTLTSVPNATKSPIGTSVVAVTG